MAAPKYITVMARKKADNSEVANTLNTVTTTKVETKVKEATTNEGEIPSIVDNALKRYPNYEKLYVTQRGFVFVEGTSEAIRKDATLYTNKYYKP